MKFFERGRDKGRKQADGAPKCAAIGSIYSVPRVKLHGSIFPFRASCVIVCPGPTLCPKHMSPLGFSDFQNFSKASRAGLPASEAKHAQTRTPAPFFCLHAMHQTRNRMSRSGFPIFLNFSKASRAGFPGIERQARPISCVRPSLSRAQYATVFCGENFCKSFTHTPIKKLKQGARKTPETGELCAEIHRAVKIQICLYNLL